jgi:UDP-N-acetylmuramoylalanine--D-glutamate ligase
MLKAILNELKDHRIVILGFGREGRSTWNLLRQALPDLPLAVADRNPVALPVPDARTRLICGPDYMDRLAGFSLLVKTPGISLLGMTLPAGLAITSQTDLFLRHATCLTVGVTGTKGKSTTTSMIHRILETDGRHALLMGNIGIPVFDCLSALRPDSIAVIEMSSHQLEHVHASPDVAVITNLHPEHLDHYASYEHYVDAKMNILRYQRRTGTCIYNADNEELRVRVERMAPGRRLPVTLSDAASAGLGNLAGINPRLAGRHNLYDALLAAAACRELGTGGEAILQGLASFPGMPHRMEDFGTFGGRRFIDNAIATIPEATLYAIETLVTVDTLIVGGMDRGLDLTPFADRLAEADVRTIICMPDTGRMLYDHLAGRHATQLLLWADDMEAAVRLSMEHTPSGGTCLLSPTASSYNRYKNFEEKGDEFQRLVRNLHTDPSGKEESHEPS